MPITIAATPDGALTPEQVSAHPDNTHAECGNPLRLLDSGKVQCLTCLKVGYPIPA